MNPVFHEPLKRLARLVSSNWFRGLTLLVAAYAAWVFRPEGVFAAPAVLCFRTGLVNGLVSLIAEKCRWRIVPGVVLLAFTYAAGLTLDGQPALPSRTQTYLASATAGANSVPGLSQASDRVHQLVDQAPHSPLPATATVLVSPGTTMPCS